MKQNKALNTKSKGNSKKRTTTSERGEIWISKKALLKGKYLI